MDPIQVNMIRTGKEHDGNRDCQKEQVESVVRAPGLLTVVATESLRHTEVADENYAEFVGDSVAYQPHEARCAVVFADQVPVGDLGIGLDRPVVETHV